MSQFFESMIVTHQARAVHTAIVTKQQIRAEWDEDGNGSLTIESNDGKIYSGTYGYKDPPQQHRCEFRRYQAANGDVVLFGKWQRFDDDPAEGC
jgi:hypothetical protein